MDILLATTNEGKLKEFKSMLLKNQFLKEYKVFYLKDFKESVTVEEDLHTFYENAFKKAKNYSEFYKMPAIAEDSGLVIQSLNGEPGVLSARYAGLNATDNDNIDLLLSRLKTVRKRDAYFQSTLVYYMNDKKYFTATGRCHGIIIDEKRGKNGFGYDPVFYMSQFQKTMAELTEDEKNEVSHRRMAMENLIEKMQEIL